MCCVHQFLMGRIAPTLVRMEDEMIDMVLSHQVEPTGHEAARPYSRVVLSRNTSCSGQEQQSPQDISKENFPDDDDDLDEFKWSVEPVLRLFSSHEREWFYHWVSDATSFGLMYITGFLDSPRDVQYDLFLRNASKHGTFLPHVLNDVDFNALRGFPLGAGGQAIPRQLHQKKLETTKIAETITMTSHLRISTVKCSKMGSVIPPSHFPIISPGLSGACDIYSGIRQGFRECLADARDSNDRDFDLTKKPSAEQVLKSVKLLKRAMDEIRKKYGIWPLERE
ncbi:unnamed protein product [Clonostachys rhizophaga]|uniref:Uncharacterized protein n=1 Tax=Clonostachys rhizophaga TaxID=160324 RepID=A0A9N9VDY6_9HYPO|nr:unnamed protein product [Clonostachys rhizophaga]